MEIIQFQSGMPSSQGSFVERNPNISYLLTSGKQAKRSILVDASADTQQIIDRLRQNQSTLEGLLITHYHEDHVFNLANLLIEFPETQIWIHPYLMNSLVDRGFRNLQPLNDGMKFPFQDDTLISIFTPGHTDDSVCFWNPPENLIFTGDTIFGGGIGCSDYNNGGNRNHFYKTIHNLLEKLPPQTNIYPGHYSEHYHFPPPYDLLTEKIRNPYIVSAICGRRGDFDRDLKNFSLEFETANYTLLNQSDIDSIYNLEKATWIPELQASRETILTRLRLGHRMLAIHENGELMGMIAWRYSDFSIFKPWCEFPREFSRFSKQKSSEPSEAHSAFIYNLGVKSTSRNQGAGSLLLQLAFEKMRQEGITQVFVDSRIPSYSGSQGYDNENVVKVSAFKEAIDRFLDAQLFPAEAEFELDPTLRFYMANGFQPWQILPNFIQDKSSGNLRIIGYINLEEDDIGYSFKNKMQCPA